MLPSSASSATHQSSSNAQLRKIKKPLIERRRRERINECLGQLKTLVLEATHKDESRYSKMEKADILEMTVAHLKYVHSCRQSSAEVAVACRGRDDDGSVVPTTGAASLRYLMGYSECVREVASYLGGDDGLAARLTDDVRSSLMRHLDGCLRVHATTAPPSGVQCGRRNADDVDPGIVDDRPSPTAFGGDAPRQPSPSTVDATPWRPRCDSGVYSAASSPTYADELAPTVWDTDTPAAHSPPSQSQLMAAAASEPPVFLVVPRLPTQTSSVSYQSDVWRPW